MSDIVGLTNGAWWVAESTGRGFNSSRWTVWSSSETWTDTVVTDIDGDGRSDLVSRAAEEGTWWVALSDGDQFVNRFSGARWQPDQQWSSVHFSDFDGDGKADLLGLNESVWVLSPGVVAGRRGR